MCKVKEFIGIDVSKDILDVYDLNSLFHQFKNNISGFKQLLKITSVSSHCVMEATGYYHLQLAYFLCVVLMRVNLAFAKHFMNEL